MEKNNYGSGGVGIASVLTIVFIVLKLVGVISWSWVWVLAPLWISFVIGILFAVIAIAVINGIHDDRR